MDIWNSAYCGSNYGPKIEIESQNGEKRQTMFHGPFSKGTTLIWDNNGENRWGARNLGGVAGFQVKAFVDWSLQPDDRRVYWYYIKYRIVGGGNDLFCPKTLTIHTTDGRIFKNGIHGGGHERSSRSQWQNDGINYYGMVVMNDWVDDKKGVKWRQAQLPKFLS